MKLGTLFALTTFAIGSIAQADVLVYSGSGVIDAAEPVAGSFVNGQAFTIEVTLDTDQASSDQNPSSNAGIFGFSPQYSIRLVVVDAGFDQVIGGNSVSTFYNASSPPIDSVSFNGDSLTITLRDEDGSALASDAIPTSLPQVSVFESPRISYFPSGAAQNFGGMFTSFTVSSQSSCAPDLAPTGAPDGVLNFFDVSAYIALYSAGDLSADFAPAGAPDGVLNFFDVSEYINQYLAGCP